jgi:hypothetical protein
VWKSVIFWKISKKKWFQKLKKINIFTKKFKSVKISTIFSTKFSKYFTQLFKFSVRWMSYIDFGVQIPFLGSEGLFAPFLPFSWSIFSWSIQNFRSTDGWSVNWLILFLIPSVPSAYVSQNFENNKPDFFSPKTPNITSKILKESLKTSKIFKIFNDLQILSKIFKINFENHQGFLKMISKFFKDFENSSNVGR